MLIKGICDLGWRIPVLYLFKNLQITVTFRAVWPEITWRFQQLGRHQNRHIVRLAVQHPSHLLRRQLMPRQGTHDAPSGHRGGMLRTSAAISQSAG